MKILSYCLLDQLKTANPMFNVLGYVGAQYKNGMVLWGEREKKYLGITDKGGDFIYIRNLNSDRTYPEGGRTDSCHVPHLVKDTFRLVAVFFDFWPEAIRNKLELDLTKVDFGTFAPRALAVIRFAASTLDQEKIFKDETSKEFTEMKNRRLKFFSIDFTMTYRLDTGLCQCDDLCSNLDFDAYRSLREECATVNELLNKLIPS